MSVIEPTWAEKQAAARKVREDTARKKNTSTLCIRNLHTQCMAGATCKCECHQNKPVNPVREQREVSKREAELDQMDRDEEDAAILQWSEDEPGRRGAKDLITTAQQAALKRNPGKWGMVRKFDGPTSAGSYAQKHKKGDSTLPKEDWQLKGVKDPGGDGSQLWAKYVGPAVDNGAS